MSWSVSPLGEQLQFDWSRPPVSSFDWDSLEYVEPSKVVRSQDIDSMNRVLTMIQRSDFACDSQIGSNARVVKLMRLVQTIINYLTQCQTALWEENAELKSRVNKLSASLHRSAERQRRLARAASTRSRLERCPACGRNFATTADLDVHMKKRHSHHFPAWMAIRENEVIKVPTGSEKVELEVAHLKQTVADLNDRFSRELDASARDRATVASPFVRAESTPQAQVSRESKSEHSGHDDFLLSRDREQPPAKPELVVQPKRRRKGIPVDLKERARNFCMRTAPLVPPATIARLSSEMSRNLYEQARAVGLKKPGQDMPTLRKQARDGLEVLVPKRGPQQQPSEPTAAAGAHQEQYKIEAADSSRSMSSD
jgi:uncharacterized C2H2 Zn-finger protein